MYNINPDDKGSKAATSNTGSTSTAIGIASIFVRPFQNMIGKSSNDIGDRFMLLANSGSAKQRTALVILNEIKNLKKQCILYIRNYLLLMKRVLRQGKVSL